MEFAASPMASHLHLSDRMAQNSLLLRKLLLSSCLFLDALAAGAIPALLPFLVTASDAQKVAQLLAINYGCTLAAMIPSGLLLLYSWHVPLLTAGLFSLLGVCLLLGMSAHLQLAMLLAGCSAEFTFAGALAMVSKLQTSEHNSAELEKGGIVEKSSGTETELEVVGQLGSSNGSSEGRTYQNKVLVSGGKLRKQRSDKGTMGSGWIPSGGAGTGKECELQSISPEPGTDLQSRSSTCRSPEVRSPRSKASLSFSEECSLQQEAPKVASDLVQDVGLLFGAQSLGYALGPSLVPLKYGFMQAWVPFAIIGGMTAVLFPPLLFLLLPKPRSLPFRKESAWGMAKEIEPIEEGNTGKEDVPLIDTKFTKPTNPKRSSSTPSLSEPKLKVKQSTPALRAFRELLTSPHALPAIVALLVEGVVVGSIDTVVPSFLKDSCHTSITANGLVFGGLALAYAVVAYKGTSWVIQKYGDLHTMAGGMALMAVALPVLSLQTLCGQLWGQLAVMIIIGSGMALMSGPVFPRLLHALEKKGIDSEGLAVIVYDVLYAGGMVVGPFVSSLITKGSWASHFLLILSVVLVLTILANYLLDCILARRSKFRAQKELPLTRNTSIH